MLAVRVVWLETTTQEGGNDYRWLRSARESRHGPVCAGPAPRLPRSRATGHNPVTRHVRCSCQSRRSTTGRRHRQGLTRGSTGRGPSRRLRRRTRRGPAASYADGPAKPRAANRLTSRLTCWCSWDRQPATNESHCRRPADAAVDLEKLLPCPPRWNNEAAVPFGSLPRMPILSMSTGRNCRFPECTARDADGRRSPCPTISL